MSNDYGVTESLVNFVYIVIVLGVLLQVIAGLVVRHVYRVEGIEDSQCRSGVLYILTDDGDGARTWKSTEAKCEVEP